MKNVIAYILIGAFICAISVAGCSKKDESENTANTETSAVADSTKTADTDSLK